MARIREFNTDEALDKVMVLFWDKGFNGVSTQEIIDELNISKSSMYGAFGDKMELFVACLNRYQHKILNQLTNQLTHTNSVKSQIKKVLTGVYTEALADKSQKGCFIVNSSIELAPHDEKIARIVSEHRAKVETIFEQAISAGINNGQITNEKNAKQISSLLCNTLNGIYVDSKYIRNKKSFENVVNSVMMVLD
ncbi:TetR/AcrR family transcriptional regulator [Flavobacterium sp. UBA7682]|uniref:TetR/AcrR family transcriptional regulator n=1 Tax=Flavobacterium sp. UBA7682 TaxID=1946560 RepID=UPI0025C42EEE|nr:TetR/AcrR family transcriptional regulator [Flavobacterium sp. UBA7682]